MALDSNKTQTKPRVPPTPKRRQVSIRHDAINPQAFMKYNLPWACEDCSHFDPKSEKCTFGYHTQWHRREYQMKTYELSGRMALCRFQEIN